MLPSIPHFVSVKLPVPSIQAKRRRSYNRPARENVELAAL
jgi:hypothetical protein